MVSPDKPKQTPIGEIILISKIANKKNRISFRTEHALGASARDQIHAGVKARPSGTPSTRSMSPVRGSTPPGRTGSRACAPRLRRKQGGPGFGQLRQALRKLLSLPDQRQIMPQAAPSCGQPRPNQPLGPRWPITGLGFDMGPRRAPATHPTRPGRRARA